MGNPLAQRRPPTPHCVYTNMSGAWRCHQCGRPPPREIVRFLDALAPIPENVQRIGRCPAVSDLDLTIYDVKPEDSRD